MASDNELTIGIDPGLTETGVVLMRRDYSVVETDLIRVEPSAAKRLWDIEQALDHITLQYSMDYHITVFIEGYAYGAKFQRESLAELGGVLRRNFYVNNFIYWVIPPRLNKLFVTGTGTANKNFMKKCTKEKWNMDFKSDDVCDAYGLARLGTAVMNYREHTAMFGGGTLDNAIEASVVLDIAGNPEHYRQANTARRPPKRKKA